MKRAVIAICCLFAIMFAASQAFASGDGSTDSGDTGWTEFA